MKMYILGIDPGFSAIGYSLVLLSPTNEHVTGMGVLHTQKAAAKRNIYASEDNVRRTREIASQFMQLFQTYKIGAICAEAMSFPRNASAAAKVAMCWGVMAVLAEQQNIPILQLSPQEVKKSLCGARDASKEDVRQSLENRYGDVILKGLLKGEASSSQEHAYDSLAVTVACLDSDAIRLVRRISCAD